MFLIVASLASVMTFIGRIRVVARRWVWRVIFPMLTALFLLCAFIFLCSWVRWRCLQWIRWRMVQNMKKRTNQKWTQILNLRHLIHCRHLHRTQEQRKRKARRRKSVVSIEKMTRQTRPRVMILMTLTHPRTVIIDADDTRTRNIGKMIRPEYEQL